MKTMGLADPLVKGILATGYTAPTEIQSQAPTGDSPSKEQKEKTPCAGGHPDA
jgi:hypothetical protein